MSTSAIADKPLPTCHNLVLLSASMYAKLHLLVPTGPTRPKSTTLRSDAEHMCTPPHGEGLWHLPFLPLLLLCATPLFEGLRLPHCPTLLSLLLESAACESGLLIFLAKGLSKLPKRESGPKPPAPCTAQDPLKFPRQHSSTVHVETAYLAGGHGRHANLACCSSKVPQSSRCIHQQPLLLHDKCLMLPHYEMPFLRRYAPLLCHCWRCQRPEVSSRL